MSQGWQEGRPRERSGEVTGVVRERATGVAGEDVTGVARRGITGVVRERATGVAGRETDGAVRTAGAVGEEATGVVRERTNGLVWKRKARELEKRTDAMVGKSRKVLGEERGKAERSWPGDGQGGVTVEEMEAEFPTVLGRGDEEVRYCRREKCGIRTKDGERIVRKGQMIPQALRARTLEYLEDLERRRVIRRSRSDWRNPMRAIEKPNWEVRIVCNLMGLNDLVEKDPYELARMRDVVMATQGSRWLTVIDQKEGFYHIEIEEEDKDKTAFEVDGRVYEWNSMVMGFKNSPQILQLVMNGILEGLGGDGVEVYMDDIVVHARTRGEHDGLAREVFRRLRENNMRVNPRKMRWGMRRVMLLGVGIEGLSRYRLR